MRTTLKLMRPALALVLVAALSLLVGQDARSQGGLRSQQSSVKAQIDAAKRERQDAVAQADETRQKLRTAQFRLRNAKEQVNGCRQAIHQAEERIQSASMAVDMAQASLEENEKLLDSRLVAIYKSGTGSYTEVVLASRDFADMTTSAYICERILDSDLSLLAEIENAKEAAELERERLHEEEARKRREEEKLAAAQTQIAAETQQCENLLAQHNAEVAKLDQELAQLAAASRQIEQELRAMSTVSSAQPAQAWTGSWQRPCGGPITSGFGMRHHPVRGGQRMHTGVDLGAGYGASVQAAGGGVVYKAASGWNGGYGNMIIVNHGNGRTTLYGHLSSINVSAGQTVTAGQSIGAVGSTGISTGPHLHFEVRINGSPINPM